MMNTKIFNAQILLLLVSITIMISCNSQLIIHDDSAISNNHEKTIKKRTIKKLKFEPTYYCTTTRSNRIILSNLEKLRSKLVSWDYDVKLSKSQLHLMIKETIVNLNIENKKENFIQTDEREWICSELEKIAITLKHNDLDEFQNYVDSFRDW